MSTFNGVIKEYPMISIDYFMSYCNFKSTVFFLSHCHTDHMVGLGLSKFFDLLEKRGFSYIYVSDVSQHLLKNDYRYSRLSNYIISLPLEEPQIIVVPDENGGFHSKVVVTLLPAGHCPGSVMFLIEGQNGRVLYTGDFRLPIGGSARLTKLHEENGNLKPLDSLYVDTTFCQRKYLHFPPREKCLSSLFNLVEQWLKKGPNYIIAFSCPAQYNYEFLFVELFERFKVKIHISEDKLRKYKGIKSIEDAVTTVPTGTQIHACFYPEPEKILKDIHIDDEPCDHEDGKPCVRITEAPCGFHTPDKSYLKLLIIRPCAMSFTNCDNNEELVYYNKKTNVHRICFSTHSSLAEVRDMVLYLKPKYVYPNVVENQTEEEILDLIYEEAPQIEDSSDLSQPPLGSLKNLNKGKHQPMLTTEL